MRNDYTQLAKGQQVTDSYGVTVEIVDYSATMHAATIRYSDGSTKWVAAETLTLTCEECGRTGAKPNRNGLDGQLHSICERCHSL